MKQDDRFLGPLLAPFGSSLMQIVFFSVVKGISWRGVKIAQRASMNKNF